MLKEKIVTIDDNGNLLKFRVRQLPATKQEELIFTVLLLIANKDMGDIDSAKIRENPQALLANPKAIFSILEKLNYQKIKPVADMLLSCCYRMAGNMEEQCTSDTVDGYISSFVTLLKLKQAALEVNFDFFGEDKNFQNTASEPKIVIGKNSKM